ncbi:hypothetical protein RZS08_63680, partial [Arthrospira platensis SPKY1]|nr:hypothetical protein [Arthrospira platensis SPKY1]
DGSLEIRYQNLTLRTSGTITTDAGFGIGVARTLDNQQTTGSDRADVNLVYSNEQLGNGFGLDVSTAFLAHNLKTGDDGFMILPPGSFAYIDERGVLLGPG